MNIMKKIDLYDLDGHNLRTFLTVLEESSVSKAAERLDVSQSSVSHTLAKLRTVLGDPLFVRSGLGIDATERARALREPIQSLLDSLKELTNERVFDPTSETLRFTVAANDFQRDLIFPRLLHEARAEGVDLKLAFLPSGVPDASILREARCHLVVTPHPPDGADIYFRPLFLGEISCFYDGACRDAPKSWEEFLAAKRIEVRFGPHQTTQQQVLSSDVYARLTEPVVSVPNFGALSAFLQGSDLLATESSLMKLGPLREFDCAPLPFKIPPVTLSAVWHQRDHNDPAHKWFRGKIRRLAESLVSSHVELQPA